MVAAKRPFTEKMAFFWHGHFATSVQKVHSPALMLGQQNIFRRQGLGAFEDLVLAVAKDPAMMLWLDTIRSSKGDPNENFAREMFELFVLGHGNYAEEDVRQAARAFTGWRWTPAGGFRVAARLHDDGSQDRARPHRQSRRRGRHPAGRRAARVASLDREPDLEPLRRARRTDRPRRHGPAGRRAAASRSPPSSAPRCSPPP